ncbi:hypothetical protein QM012_009444 [Aureobasidium pullulans]|uniref:YTH domain-containing protein n=1 Tax=Aureobasidium pullulans TaxID=5580 RepID=A0ABR0TGW1_AURPU
MRDASRNSRASNRSHDSTQNGKENQSRRPSLLEELFPEEAQPEHQTSTRPKERNIPRLDVRASLPKPNFPHQEQREHAKRVNKDNWWNRKTEPAESEPDTALDRRRRQRVEGVLMLRNASKTLVEDDFTRLIPQGLHIEGWTLDQADIVKVVPGRNTSTLERANFYFILFSSRAAMNAYRTHVISLHSLASRHVQSSLTSPIPPPPGYHLNGQDIDSLLQTYTLLPPSRVLHLLPLPMQVSPSIVDIIHNQGYPDIVKGPLKEPYVVMIRLEGPQLPITMVRGVLGKVERERRIPWNREFGHLSYRIWEPKPKNVSPLSTNNRLDKGGNKTRNRWLEDIEELAEMDNALGEEDRHDERPGGRERRKARSSYLFGFDSEDAALTFVQYWHRRSLDMSSMNFDTEDTAPVVEAELLW